MEIPICAPVSEGDMGEGYDVCAIVDSPTMNPTSHSPTMTPTIHNDEILCGSKTVSGCTVCVDTTMSDGTNCLWYDPEPGQTYPFCFHEDDPSLGQAFDTCIDDSPCWNQDLSCESCLLMNCGWTGACQPSCELTPDATCYDTSVLPVDSEATTPAEVCEIANIDKVDQQLCASKTDEGCTSCLSTLQNDSSPCNWFLFANKDAVCISSTSGEIFGSPILDCPSSDGNNPADGNNLVSAGNIIGTPGVPVLLMLVFSSLLYV